MGKQHLVISIVATAAIGLSTSNLAFARDAQVRAAAQGHVAAQAGPRASRPFVRGNRVISQRPVFRRGVFVGPSWYYDPYWYGTWGYPYAYGYSTAGGIRLEVKPSSAQVFVDGYYAGKVSEFDGIFQQLTLTPGGHHIEIRAPGYQTMSFETYIQNDHTTDWKARMVPSANS